MSNLRPPHVAFRIGSMRKLCYVRVSTDVLAWKHVSVMHDSNLHVWNCLLNINYYEILYMHVFPRETPALFVCIFDLLYVNSEFCAFQEQCREPGRSHQASSHTHPECSSQQTGGAARHLRVHGDHIHGHRGSWLLWLWHERQLQGSSRLHPQGSQQRRWGEG